VCVCVCVCCVLVICILYVYCTLTELFLTLTDGFPCFFISCKANARVPYLVFGIRILHCVCFNLYCGGFIMFCNVCVCVCVGREVFVMCGCFDNMYTVL
jgi:hypothetical protein